MSNTSTIIYALLGGILPALVWLAFWLREDAKHPEPRGLILRTFFLGMAAVVLVLPFQKVVDDIFPGMVLAAFLLWAILEEGFKLTAAYIGGLKSKEDNEPIDPLIYLITAALGFTAFENALFIVNPLLQSNIAEGLITGNLRFIGASVLHVISSAILGVALSLSFYKSLKVRIMWVLVAFLLATGFHTAFNLILVNQGVLGAPLAFGSIWISVVILLLFFEKIKTLRPPLSTSTSSQVNSRHDTI